MGYRSQVLSKSIFDDDDDDIAWDSTRTLGIGLRKGPTWERFLVSEILLYRRV